MTELEPSYQLVLDKMVNTNQIFLFYTDDIFFLGFPLFSSGNVNFFHTFHYFSLDFCCFRAQNTKLRENNAY